MFVCMRGVLAALDCESETEADSETDREGTERDGTDADTRMCETEGPETLCVRDAAEREERGAFVRD